MSKNEAILQALRAVLEARDTAQEDTDWEAHELDQYALGVFCTELDGLGFSIQPTPGTRPSTPQSR